jgi:protein arginine kinase
MIVDDLIRRPAAWLAAGGEAGAVVSSRIRLARNLREAAFPGWAGEEECGKIWQKLRELLQSAPTLAGSFAIGMDELDLLDRQILFERHLISREHAGKGRGSGLVGTPDERLAIMVNEEDHLRMQVIRPGLDLREAWSVMNALDDELGGRVDYAFSPRLGYLTACPSNVGTGLRASVMLHLPGLVLMNEMDPVIKGVTKIGMAVRGLWGEGTEAVGNMFQVSNQVTLGEKEGEIVHSLEQIVLEIIEHEKNARARLRDRKEAILRDHVGRSRGILENAHILSSKEALDLLSGLRLGLEMGILKCVDRRRLDELLVLTQPAHLQKREGRKLKPRHRDLARAQRVRQVLVEAGVKPVD